MPWPEQMLFHNIPYGPEGALNEVREGCRLGSVGTVSEAFLPLPGTWEVFSQALSNEWVDE